MLTEDYLDDASPEFPYHRSPDVRYFYDAPAGTIPLGDVTSGTPRNTKGFLAYVQDPSGEEHISYDARGRVEYEVKRIPDPMLQQSNAAPTQLVSFRTRFDYDSLDRITRLTYPDNDEVTHEYNARNLLRRIVGGVNGLTAAGNVISNIAYRPSAQLSEIDYGNGVRTAYDYDPRLRLRSLASRQPTLGSRLIDFTYDFDGANNITSIHDGRPDGQVPAGDPRRNTQLFQYDDLYRITRAQYSFNLPGEAVRNDGEINYRYDRTGNMLAQTSTIVHDEQGLPIANLGIMDSGGAAGRSNRVGRASADPPGPHALSRIRHPSGALRQYSYDANGNMAEIDGLRCTWDFKDRLVRVENDAMIAEYRYDYTDRRIMKRVWQKNSLAPTGGEGQGEGATPSLATLYINKYFEVRAHDQPTKYVWNGDTRVARVIGSLSANNRVQRLRVGSGWNLASLAVSAADALGQMHSHLDAGSRVQSALRWNQDGLDWQPVGTNESLSAGTVLWLSATTNSVLSLTGVYSDPTNLVLSAGGQFVPATGLEANDLESTISNTNSMSVWIFETVSNDWRVLSETSVDSDSPVFIAPGGVWFVRANTTISVEVPETTLRIRYYHQDHLGSSSVLTDAAGHLAEDMANYAFGHPRNHHHPRGIGEPYSFAQKERENEAELHYFEARFMVANLGRFTRVDPILTALPTRLLPNPQALNAYSYSVGNPLNYLDPSGGESFAQIIDRRGVDAASRDNTLATATWATAFAVNQMFNPAESFRETQRQADIAFDPNKNTADRAAGAAGMVGYSVQTVLDVVGIGELAKAAGKGGSKIVSAADGFLKARMATAELSDLAVRAERMYPLVDAIQRGHGLQISEHLTNISKTEGGQVVIRELHQTSSKMIDLMSKGPASKETFEAVLQLQDITFQLKK